MSVKNRPPAAGIANENFLNSDRFLGKYKIKTAEELQARVDKFFESRKDAKKPATITGLALAIGLSSRQSIINYEKRDEFYEVIREARLRIYDDWETQLDRLGNNAGIMYYLQNNTAASEQYVSKIVQDTNIGGQPGNPVQVQSVDTLSEDQLKRLEAILSEDSLAD